MSIKQIICNEILQMKGQLDGLYLSKNGYEKEFCQRLGWTCHGTRYYDAITSDGYYIEIKKGQGNYWLDSIRYAEQLHNNFTDSNIKTLFIRYKHNKKVGTYTIEQIYIIGTSKLIDIILGPNKVTNAQQILALNSDFFSRGKRNNNQVSLSCKDIENYSIKVF